MGVAVRVLLAIGLVAAHVPVCKVAAAQSLVPTRSHAPQAALPAALKCKRGCCLTAKTPASDSPKKPDRSAPGKQNCPASCLNPLCSPAPALQPSAAPAVATDLGPTEHLVVQPQTSAADVFHGRIDRPPRV